MVGRDVNGVCGRVMAHRQPKVGDTACAILLHQDILGLQVTVGNGRLTWVDSSKRHKGIVSPLRTDWVCASLWSTNLMQTSLFFYISLWTGKHFRGTAVVFKCAV